MTDYGHWSDERLLALDRDPNQADLVRELLERWQRALYRAEVAETEVERLTPWWVEVAGG